MKLSLVQHIHGTGDSQPNKAYYNRNVAWGDADTQFETQEIRLGELVGWYDAADLSTINTYSSAGEDLVYSWTNKADGMIYGDLRNTGTAVDLSDYIDNTDTMPVLDITTHAFGERPAIVFDGLDSYAAFRPGTYGGDTVGTGEEPVRTSVGGIITVNNAVNDIDTGCIVHSVSSPHTYWKCIDTHDVANSLEPGGGGSWQTQWQLLTNIPADLGSSYNINSNGLSSANVAEWTNDPIEQQENGSFKGEKPFPEWNLTKYWASADVEWIQAPVCNLNTGGLGTSPILNSTGPISGMTIAVVFKSLPDPDAYTPPFARYEGTPYDYPDEAGVGTLINNSQPWLNVHAPWSDGELYFDTRIPTTNIENLRRLQTASNPADPTYSGPDQVNGTSYWEILNSGKPQIVTYRFDIVNCDQTTYLNGQLYLHQSHTFNDPITAYDNAIFRIGAVPWNQAAAVGEVLFWNDAVDVQKVRVIEGYLAHKWCLLDTFFDGHPYKMSPPTLAQVEEIVGPGLTNSNYNVYRNCNNVGSGPPGERLWRPSDITTQAWYDASDSPTVVHTSGTVNQWSDKSGNNNSLTVTNTNNTGPYTGTRTLNGLNVLEWVYTGTGPTAGNSLQSNTFTHDQATTALYISFVVQVDTNTSSVQDFLFAFTNITTQGNRMMVRHQSGAGQQQLQIIGGSGTGSNQPIGTGASSMLEDTAYLVTIKFNQSNSEVFINGTSINTGNLGTNTMNLFMLGHNEGYGGDLDGYFAEIVMHTSASELERVEGYLAHKWGLNSNLPGGHAYASSAPVYTPPSSSTFPMTFPIILD